jgi:hypothetical protein
MIIACPLFVSYLSKYFNGERDIKWGLTFGLFISLSLFVSMIIQQLTALSVYRYGMQIRLALNGLVFKKVNQTRAIQEKFAKKNLFL